MGAPFKQGLDYFPFDVDLLSDSKFRSARRKYGYLSQLVYVTVLSLLYKDKGYYIDYDDNKKEDVLWKIEETLRGGKFSPTSETIAEIIECLAACELFSGDCFKRKIITSKRVQQSYYKSVAERKMVAIDFDIWLLSKEEMKVLSNRCPILTLFINRTINEDNPPNNEDNQPNNPQSKVKESKVEYSIVDDSRVDDSRVDDSRVDDSRVDDSRVNRFEAYASGSLLYALNDFEEMRKAIKRPLNDKACELLLKRLDELTDNEETKIKILEKSILRNWAEVYPLNENKNTSNIKPTSFSNFKQPDFDYKSIEARAVGKKNEDCI